MLTGMLIAVVLVTAAAALATPHAKLKAWWQASTAKLLYDEVRRQLDAAQSQPTPPPAQGEQDK